MFEKLYLQLLDKCQSVFEKFGIEYFQLRQIITVKFTMDRRRSSAFTAETKSKERNALIASWWIYVLYGLILVYFIFNHAYMIQMSMMFGVSLFMMMTAIVTEFSSVLLDRDGRQMLLTKSVAPRTITAAKYMHILFYLLMFLMFFALTPIVFMLFVQGFRFTILFMVMLSFVLLFAMGFTHLLYFFVLKFFEGHILKKLISLVQILFAITIIVGYQMVIRLYGYVDLVFHYDFEWWHLFIPPLWFAAPFEWLLGGQISFGLILLTGLGIFLPLIALRFSLKWMPLFESHLEKLNRQPKNTRPDKHLYERFWMKMTCFTPHKQSMFKFIYRAISGDDIFKLKTMPSVGIGLVFPFIFLFSLVGVQSFDALSTSKLYFCIYLLNIFMSVLIYSFQFSSKSKATWIFHLTDYYRVHAYYQAVLKVFMVKYYLPVFLLVSIGYAFIFKTIHLSDYLIVLITTILQALLTFQLLIPKHFPFTFSIEEANQQQNTLKAFGAMGMVIPFVLLHYLSSYITYGAVLYGFLLLATTIFVWRWIFYKPLTARHKV